MTSLSEPTASDQLSAVVAKHYNSLEEKGVEARKESAIYHMRNFNNWIKSVIIGEWSSVQFIAFNVKTASSAEVIDKVKKNSSNKKINVLDIGCGKGGDLLKYKKANISHIICAGIVL